MFSIRLRGAAAVVAASILLAALSPASGIAAKPAASHFVVKDSRNIEANSVRFAAAQGTKDMPNIVLLGGNEKVWPKIRGAVMQAEAEGYPVRAILVGPSSAVPALEVYAKGLYVSKPVSPYSITQAELVKLIRDVNHEYYGR